MHFPIGAPGMRCVVACLRDADYVRDDTLNSPDLHSKLYSNSIY